MKIEVILFAISWLILCGVFSQRVNGHEFERGHVERSIDVVIRSKKIHVKYSVGMADETILDLLARSKMIESDVEAKYRKSIADLEALESNKTTGAAEAGNPESPPPLKFQTELMDLLRQEMANPIAEQLELFADGKPLAVDKVQVMNSARHHVALEINLVATVKSDEAIELSVIDKNFLQLDKRAGPGQKEATQLQALAQKADPANQPDDFLYSGNSRLACRAKGLAVLVRSNVAPVLARAETVAVGKLPLAERLESMTIRTKIAFAKPSKR